MVINGHRGRFRPDSKVKTILQDTAAIIHSTVTLGEKTLIMKMQPYFSLSCYLERHILSPLLLLSSGIVVSSVRQ